jgi:hypothetical protein
MEALHVFGSSSSWLEVRKRVIDAMGMGATTRNSREIYSNSQKADESHTSCLLRVAKKML